jgi:hypothetical protein
MDIERAKRLSKVLNDRNIMYEENRVLLWEAMNTLKGVEGCENEYESLYGLCRLRKKRVIEVENKKIIKKYVK